MDMLSCVIVQCHSVTTLWCVKLSRNLDLFYEKFLQATQTCYYRIKIFKKDSTIYSFPGSCQRVRTWWSSNKTRNAWGRINWRESRTWVKCDTATAPVHTFLPQWTTVSLSSRSVFKIWLNWLVQYLWYVQKYIFWWMFTVWPHSLFLWLKEHCS